MLLRVRTQSTANGVVAAFFQAALSQRFASTQPLSYLRYLLAVRRAERLLPLMTFRPLQTQALRVQAPESIVCDFSRP